MGVMLSQPVELTRVQRKGSVSFRAAVAEMQGWRTNHEDAHAFEFVGDTGSFWVLDGHGGDAASEFCAPQLAKKTSKLLEDSKGLPDDEFISKSFEDTDRMFREHVAANPKASSGSTVVGCLITKGEDGLYSLKVMNAGDSRALVIAPPDETEASASASIKTTRPDHFSPTEDVAVWPVINASIDHKPDHPVEKSRIETAGGFVSQDDPPRLDGNLAVSRGVGDFEYKGDPSKPASVQKVSCIPDVYEAHGLKPGSIVLLACDGLWDVMSNDQVAQSVRADLKDNANADLGIICTELVQKALKEDSRDNVTCMIIQLVDGTCWSKQTNRFNESDEMMYFDKIVANGGGGIDDEVRKQSVDFLRRCGFPDKPVQCAESGRWFDKMFKCPGTDNVYMSRHCQKKGWSRHKAGEPIVKKARAEDA